MNRLRNNIIANFGGQAATVLLGVIFLPLYVRIMGIEAYGLIGFYVGLQAFFFVLDMGLSSTLNRELARSGELGPPSDRQRDTVRTLEWVYWPIGALIATFILALSIPIASHWLKPSSFGAAQTAHAIALMGLATALQWPAALYGGGLRGLERQVPLNAITVFFALLRALGSVAVLSYVSPTLDAFLWWQIVCGALQTVLLRRALWQALPSGQDPPRFRFEILRGIHRFSMGMSAITALSFVLMQSDRLILSAILRLDMFGYYVVAATVAGAISSMVGPFFNALFPRYTALVESGRDADLAALYHSSNQQVSVAVASVAAVLAFFSADLLLLWTRDATLASQSAPILSVMVVGTALNGLMHLPYALQLAFGWVRLALYQNLIAVTIMVPAIWWAAHTFGGVGAASAWLVLNIGYFAVSIPVMHRRLLRAEMKSWYLKDVLPPALAAVSCAGLAKLFASQYFGGPLGLVGLGIVGICTSAAAAASVPHLRLMASNALLRWRG